MAIALQIAVPQIQNLEGIRQSAYRDIAGVLTVCAGHTGPDVVVDKIYTTDQCSHLTQIDAEKAASGVLKVSPQLLFHPIVLASAVSFSYNIGIGRYDSSSVARDFNKGDLIAGCNDMLKYTSVDHKFNQGLANRRKVENQLCLSTLTPKGMSNAGLTTPT